MIVIVKSTARPQEVEQLKKEFEAMGLQIHLSQGANTTLMGLVGGYPPAWTSARWLRWTLSREFSESRSHTKRQNRKFHPQDTVVDVAGVRIGAGDFTVIAGPCSVETPEQITAVARAVQQSGAVMLRGGAFKPRTSPYAFQGLHDEGIRLLLKAKQETGLPIVTEIMSYEDIDLFEQVDLIQVGARNMQNFELLKRLGKQDKPILLKRGLANTIEEFLMSAEYIMAQGNEQVILCERGIRTYENATRNTLDLSAVPLLKKRSHLPVVVDPSHATGIPWMVEPMTLAAIAAGADGVMIEVHNDPPHALCDGAQSLRPEQFDALMGKVKKTAQFFKTLD